MITFSCPHCQAGLNTRNDQVGKHARCPNCLRLIEVPKSFGQAGSPIALVETKVSAPSPTGVSDTLEFQRKGIRKKTKLLLLSLGIMGLACAGLIIIDTIATSNSPDPVAPAVSRVSRPAPRPADMPVERSPLPVALFEPLEHPITRVIDVKKMARAPVDEPRVRLGTLRFRHGSAVQGLAVSHQSNILASWGMNDQICVWDLRTGIALRRLSANGEGLHCVALSGDGRWIAAGTDHGSVYLWEVATGKEVGAWRKGNAIGSLAFSPDNRTLASADVRNGIVLWEVPDASNLRTWPTRRADSLTFSPDGMTVAACLPDAHGAVMLLDHFRGRQRRGFDFATVLTFSPDGRSLATGGDDGRVHLWELATGKELHCLDAHSGVVCQVAFAPDGKSLATVGTQPRKPRNGSRWGVPVGFDAQLWDVATGQKRCCIEPTGHQIRAVAFSADGKTLYTGGDDHAIRLWDTTTGKELDSEYGPGAVTAVAIAPNGKIAITGQKDGRLQAWDVATGHLLRQYRGHQSPLRCVAYSSDGSLLVSGGGGVSAGRFLDTSKDELLLWDAGTAKEIRRLDTGGFPVNQVRFLPGCHVIAEVADFQGPVHVWQAGSGKELYRFDGQGGFWPAFSPDGSLVTLWRYDAIKVWDLADRRCVGAWRPDISLASFDPGQDYRDLHLSAQALSPGGRYLACATTQEGGRIHIFKVATGEKVDLPEAHVAPASHRVWEDTVRSLAWSHDGKMLASGGEDGQVWLWDPGTARALRRGIGHEGPVTALAFSADDRTLISGSDDTTALVWDLTGIRNGASRK